VRSTALALGLALAVTGCGRHDAGVRAYREGRFADALAAFSAATRGGEPTPDDLYGLAASALATGDVRVAQSAAEEAVRRGGAPFEGRRSFVRGSVAYALSEAAEAEAARPDADPAAADAAMRHAEDAVASWRAAAASRDDWPAARRNLERALRRLATLREKQPKKGAGSRPREEPLPPLPAPADAPEEAPPPVPARPEDTTTTTTDLPADQVMKVLDRLVEKEREKAQARRAAAPPRKPGEKDW
jgi:hypothetical protein